MYKLSYVKFLIALAAVCPAVLNAQEQPTYTDLYYNKDLNTTGWRTAICKIQRLGMWAHRTERFLTEL